MPPKPDPPDTMRYCSKAGLFYAVVPPSTNTNCFAGSSLSQAIVSGGKYTGAAVLCVIVAWFAILLTGNFPRGLFDFVVGVLRWGLRVSAYAFLLTTDRYPPFSLAP